MKRVLRSILLLISSIVLVGLASPSALSLEWVLRGRCPNCNTGVAIEHFCVGQPGLMACDNNSTSIFGVYTTTEIDSKLDAIKSDLDKRLLAQQKLVQQISDELLRRFGEIPLELAKNEVAYDLLRKRLTKDLAEVFQAKAGSQ